jgi:hypothetical protein
LKKGFIVILFGYILILIETALGSLFQFGQVRLDGLVPLIAWHGLQSGLPSGIVPVLGLGVLSEQTSVMQTGLYTISYVGEYLVIRYILNHVAFVAIWQTMILVSFLSVEIMAILLVGSGAADLFWPWGFIQALLNGIFVPFWFFIFDKANSIIFSSDR